MVLLTRIDQALAQAGDYAERVSERTLAMARLWSEQGWSYEEIGAEFGISRQRVHQLLKPLGLGQRFNRAFAERVQRLHDAHARILAAEGTLSSEAERLGYANADSLRTQLHSIGLKFRASQQEPEHGTLARYRRGCTCDLCRQANAELSRKRYAKSRTTAEQREAARAKTRKKRVKKRRQKEVVS